MIGQMVQPVPRGGWLGWESLRPSPPLQIEIPVGVRILGVIETDDFEITERRLVFLIPLDWDQCSYNTWQVFWRLDGDTVPKFSFFLGFFDEMPLFMAPVLTIEEKADAKES